MAIRYWCEAIPTMKGDKCTVTVVEYDTEETGAGPFAEVDATGRSFTEAFDVTKESLLDLRDRLQIMRDDANEIRAAALERQIDINTWLTNNDL